MKQPSISFHHNFLDTKLLEKIKTYATSQLVNYKWKTSHCWSKAVKRLSSPIAILQVP